MDYNEFILIVNASSIIILLALAMLLLIATRFRGESGYAAAIAVIPTVPVYLYNMSRMLEWHEMTLLMFPSAYSVNTTLMPLLWLFTLRNFKPDFRLKPVYFLHFIPAVICMAVALFMSVQERLDTIVYEASGDDTWVGDLNYLIIIGQIIIYFTIIFRYIRRAKRYIAENCSDAEYFQKEWIERFMMLFAFLFFIVVVAYVISPRTDAWLIQILNVIGMFYLTYSAIAHPAMILIRRVPEPAEENADDISQDSSSTFIPDAGQMKENCEKIVDYLTSSQAYRRNDLSLAVLSKEMGFSQKIVSRSINSCLNRNFFELINEMRVREAKRRLLLPENSGYTVESIYEECGFRTRSTFFLAFKKVEGISPAQWLKSAKSNPR